MLINIRKPKTGQITAQVTIEYIVIFMIVLVVILASIKTFIIDRDNERGLYQACEGLLKQAVEKIDSFRR